MIVDITVGMPVERKTWVKQLSKFKKIKEALDKKKSGNTDEEIKLEDIPF